MSNVDLASPMDGSLVSEIAPIVQGGYCVGCGACAVAAPDRIEMRRDEDGVFRAFVRDPDALAGVAGGICPFSENAPDEDNHARRLFSDARHEDPLLGLYDECYAGSVSEAEYRANGSSGGLTTWVCVELLQQAEIDAVLHVQPRQDPDNLFEYRVSRSANEVRDGAKSRYYSVNFADGLLDAAREGLRVAVVGVPCFIKAIQNLCVADERIRQTVRFTVAIFCGHLKGPGFAESLAWQSGVQPKHISGVDFRTKLLDRPASTYGFSATDIRNGETCVTPMTQLAGRRWDGGYFKLKACEYCDDVVGETADVALGDAWLPEYVHDSHGTNVVVVRNPRITQLLKQGAEQKRLDLDILSRDRVVASQAGGFRDRREALRFRLWIADRKGKWRPKKRVQPSRDHLNAHRRLTYQFRRFVRHRSFRSFRFSRRVGFVGVYRLEATIYHAFLRAWGLMEGRSRKAQTSG